MSGKISEIFLVAIVKNYHSFLFGDTAHWLLYALVAGVVLFIVLNAADSTLLKSAWLLWCSAALLCVAAYRAAAGGIVRIEARSSYLPVALYFLASLCSLLYAVNTRLAWDSFVMLAGSVVIFVATHELIDSTREINRFLSVLYTLIGISCVVGVVLRFFSPSVISIMELSGRDMISTFGNASYFAGFLAAAVPLIFGKIFDSSLKPASRVGFGLFLCFTLYVLAETGTRSAWIGASAAVVLFAFLYARSILGRLVLLMIFACAGLTVLFLSSDIVEKRLTHALAIDLSSSFARRFFFFEGAWNAFLASPVTGHGLGNISVVLPKFRSPDYWTYRSEDVVPHVHNEFLEILAETGIAGFIPWILLVSYISVVALRRFPPAGGNQDASRVAFLSIWCALIGILVDNLGNMSLRTVPVAVLFWMLLAILSRNLTERRFTVELVLPKALKGLKVLPGFVLAVYTILLVRTEADRLTADQLALEGNLLHYLEHSPAATLKYEQALSRNPYHEQARFNLASSLLQHGRYEEARDRVRSLLEEYPWYPKAHLIAAAASAELDDTAQAMRHFAAELALRSHPQAYFFMSQMYRKREMEREELVVVNEMLRQSIRGNETMLLQYGISRIGVLCRPRSDCDSSYSLLDEAGKRFSSDVGVLLAVGDAYYTVGLPRAAIEWYARAGGLDPKNRVVEERLKRAQRSLHAEPALR